LQASTSQSGSGIRGAALERNRLPFRFLAAAQAPEVILIDTAWNSPVSVATTGLLAAGRLSGAARLGRKNKKTSAKIKSAAMPIDKPICFFTRRDSSYTHTVDPADLLRTS
jgi:hypothetical protein